MNRVAYFFSIILTSCALGGSAITSTTFQEIQIGTSAPDMIATAGQPYAIHRKEDGFMEYEYIERLKIGDRDAEIRRYYFLIKDGKVVSKRTEQSTSAPYLFDSYEMQTTQTSSEEK